LALSVSETYTALKKLFSSLLHGRARWPLRAAVLLPVLIIFSISAPGQGKNPVIIIPGLIGSELVNGKSGEVVWFKPQRAKDDDLRLPISPNLLRNRDGLEAKDVLRTYKIGIFPKSDVYEGLAKALEAWGYSEGKWINPPVNGYENTFYCFAYDWRRDNVENARMLIRQIQALKKKLNKPDLKFDVIGHSMGGLIARYAAMYGDADIPAGRRPVPTWAGASNFRKIFLLGTPNEGSVRSLDSLINGVSFFGISINLPFFQNLTKFDLFTIPAAYELLPADGTLKAFDENLKPLKIDIYNPATWAKYGWSVMDDKSFGKEFSPAEQKSARAYFVTVLNRAKAFQAALNAPFTGEIPVSINLVGSDCKPTLDAVVIYRDAKEDRWKTIFKADSFPRADGQKVTSDELKAVIYGKGDGVVSDRSRLADTLKEKPGAKPAIPSLSNFSICEEHDKLPGNAEIQNYILSELTGNQPPASPAKH
jgi:pimeloyl-ACP methyl ester carboxylesterase